MTQCGCFKCRIVDNYKNRKSTKCRSIQLVNLRWAGHKYLVTSYRQASLVLRLLLLLRLRRRQVGESLGSESVRQWSDNDMALDPRVIHHVDQRQPLIGVMS